jgi:hypothetical protein
VADASGYGLAVYNLSMQVQVIWITSRKYPRISGLFAIRKKNQVMKWPVKMVKGSVGVRPGKFGVWHENSVLEKKSKSSVAEILNVPEPVNLCSDLVECKLQ